MLKKIKTILKGLLLKKVVPIAAFAPAAARFTIALTQMMIHLLNFSLGSESKVSMVKVMPPKEFLATLVPQADSGAEYRQGYIY